LLCVRTFDNYRPTVQTAQKNPKQTGPGSLVITTRVTEDNCSTQYNTEQC